MQRKAQQTQQCSVFSLNLSNLSSLPAWVLCFIQGFFFFILLINPITPWTCIYFSCSLATNHTAKNGFSLRLDNLPKIPFNLKLAFVCLCMYACMLGIRSRTSHMWSMCSKTKPYAKSYHISYIKFCLILLLEWPQVFVCSRMHVYSLSFFWLLYHLLFIKLEAHGRQILAKFQQIWVWTDIRYHRATESLVCLSVKLRW